LPKLLNMKERGYVLQSITACIWFRNREKLNN
jgi:hypothetical protein